MLRGPAQSAEDLRQVQTAGGLSRRDRAVSNAGPAGSPGPEGVLGWVGYFGLCPQNGKYFILSEVAAVISPILLLLFKLNIYC